MYYRFTLINFINIECRVIFLRFDNCHVWTGNRRDPKNDIGLIKVKWPPLGYENQENGYKVGTENITGEEKRKLRRRQRLFYREKIADPICLTYDKMDLIQESAQGLVSGSLCK